MKIVRFLIAFIGCFIIVFHLGGLGHMILMTDFSAQNMPAQLIPPAEPQLYMFAIAYLVLTLLMTVAYQILFKNNEKILVGLLFGIFFGITWVFPNGIIVHFLFDIPFKLLFVDVLWHFVEQGLGGVFLALIYKWKFLKR